MAVMLPPPSIDILFYGAVREALASSHATAVDGSGETRAWDALDSYVVDNEEGGFGVLSFAAGAVFGVLRSLEAWRPIDVDVALLKCPESVRGRLGALCRLPLFLDDGVGLITAVFWSGERVLESIEPWHAVHVHGAELLERELVADREWVEVAGQYYGIDQGIAASLCDIARRRTDLDPLVLTESELELVVPRDARCRTEGLARLMSGGAVTVSDSSG